MWRALVWFSRILLALFVIVLLWVGWLYWQATVDLPDHRVLLSHEEWRAKCQHTDGPQAFTPLTSMPPHVINAFVAQLDADYYKRAPFNLWAFATWVVQVTWRKPNRSSQPSVFTQYAMTDLECRRPSGLRGFQGVMNMLLLAYRIERDIPKDVLVERYLNLAPRERHSYGVADVAQAFFRKPLNQLTLAEAAFLVRTSSNSSSFFYWGSPTGRQLERAVERRNMTLRKMAEAGFITAVQAEEASREPLALQKPAPQN